MAPDDEDDGPAGDPDEPETVETDWLGEHPPTVDDEGRLTRRIVP